MEFKIKKELLENVINYLANKPYKETYWLINALQNIEVIEKKEEVKPEEKGNK